MNSTHTEQAKIFKAFCDENRLAILQMLRRGELCACHIQAQLPIGQSTLSHHMKVLCDSGIVCGRREGKWMHYSINSAGSRHAVQLLHQLTTVQGGQENAV